MFLVTEPDLKPIDYNLLQLQYEILGEPVAKLAAEYDTTALFIQYAIDSRGWKQRGILKALARWDDYDNLKDIPPDLLEDVENRQNLLELIKRKTLNPSYMAFESSLLGKCREAIENIDPANPAAPSQLKQLSEIYEKLKTIGSNGGSKADQNLGSVQPSININIATRSAQIAAVGAAGQIEGAGRPAPLNAQKRIGESTH